MQAATCTALGKGHLHAASLTRMQSSLLCKESTMKITHTESQWGKGSAEVHSRAWTAVSNVNLKLLAEHQKRKVCIIDTSDQKIIQAMN